MLAIVRCTTPVVYPQLETRQTPACRSDRCSFGATSKDDLFPKTSSVGNTGQAVIYGPVSGMREMGQNEELARGRGRGAGSGGGRGVQYSM